MGKMVDRSKSLSFLTLDRRTVVSVEKTFELCS